MQSFKQLYLNKSTKNPKAGYNRINNVLWKSTVIKGTVICITQLNFSSIPFTYSNRMYMCGSELNFKPSLYKHTPCCPKQILYRVYLLSVSDVLVHHFEPLPCY